MSSELIYFDVSDCGSGLKGEGKGKKSLEILISFITVENGLGPGDRDRVNV
jgi:hypothetical protein